MANATTRPKKHGCLKAFFITLFVIALLIWIVVGVAMIVGNSILKKQFGVSIYDVISAFNDIGVYDAKEIVTNPYDKEADAYGFYGAVNDAMFFKNGSDGTKAVIDSEYVKALLENGDGLDGGDPTDELLKLLDKNNFNTDALSAYDATSGASHLENISSVTDKELAAFVNDFIVESTYFGKLTIGGSSEEETAEDSGATDGETESESKGVQIMQFVSLDQIILRMGGDMTEAKKAAYNVTNDDHVYLTMTVSIDTKKLVGEVLKHYVPSLPGIAVWAVGLMVPEKSYATVTVDVNDAAYGISLELNSLASKVSDMTRCEKNAEIFDKYADAEGHVTRMERIYIIAECFAGIDLPQMLNDYGKVATDYICVSDGGFTVGNMIAKDAFTEDGKTKTVTKDGKFKVDMYGLFASMLNGSTGGNATGKDIILLLQSLLCTSGAEGARRAEGAKIGDQQVVGDDKEYCREFFEAINDAYGLNIADTNFDRFVKLLTNDPEKSDGESGQEIDAFAGEVPTKNGTAQITDRMFAAMISELMELGSEEFSDAGGEDTGFNAYRASVSAIAIRQDGGATYADLAVTLDISKMVAGENAKLFEKLLPEAVTITLKADITPGSTAEKAEIIGYNELSKTGDETVLSGLTVDGFLSSFSAVLPSLDLKTVTNRFAKGVHVVVSNLDSTLSGMYTFVPTSAAA